MSPPTRQNAASQLADFLGLAREVRLPGNALLALQSFTAAAEGPRVSIEARYIRISLRIDCGLDEVIKGYELREITDGQGEQP